MTRGQETSGNSCQVFVDTCQNSGSTKIRLQNIIEGVPVMCSIMNKNYCVIHMEVMPYVLNSASIMSMPCDFLSTSC